MDSVLNGQPVVPDTFVFCLCTEGSLRFRINHSEYDVSSGDVFVVLPQHIFSVLEKSDDLNVKSLHISPDDVQSMSGIPDFGLLRKMSGLPCIKACGMSSDLETIYDLILKYTGTERPADIRIRESLVRTLVLMTSSLYDDASVPGRKALSRKESIVSDFFDLLLEELDMRKSLSYYADRLCVTPKYLSVAVSEVTGHTIRDWINEAILITAKKYIMTTGYSVQQISEKLDFQTSSSFVRFFRKNTGYTPLEYRRTNRG